MAAHLADLFGTRHVLDAEPSRRTIAQVESLQPLRRTYTDLGAPRPPHQGAPGKALLAFTSPARLALAREQLADDTAALAELDEQLARVRADGYAISLEERVPGVVAIAMPVFDHTGPVAALSVSIPAVRAGRDELVALVPDLRRAAEWLSDRLGSPVAATQLPEACPTMLRLVAPYRPRHPGCG